MGWSKNILILILIRCKTLGQQLHFIYVFVFLSLAHSTRFAFVTHSVASIKTTYFVQIKVHNAIVMRFGYLLHAYQIHWRVESTIIHMPAVHLCLSLFVCACVCLFGLLFFFSKYYKTSSGRKMHINFFCCFMFEQMFEPCLFPMVGKTQTKAYQHHQKYDSWK